jgi:TPR repeat protein
MKKLFLTVLVLFSTFAQAQVASVCSYAEKLIPIPKGKQFSLEEWRQIAKVSNLDSRQADAAFGMLSICGIGVNKDVAKGLELLVEAAQAGDKEAVKLLFGHYNGSDGVPVDEVKAMHWLHVGANYGDPQMQAELGRRYMLGSWVNKDAALAERWISKAAAAGLPDAYVLLGQLHAGNKNYAEAMRWFNLGVAADQPYAYALLGSMYLEGLGIPADPQEGLRLLKVAAKTLPQSQYALGWWHAYGPNVPRNLEEAAKWFRLAAENGNVDAQEALANAFEWGIGVPQNLKETNAWRKKAADGGSQLAKQKLEEAKKNAQVQAAWQKEAEDRERALREATHDGSAKSKITLARYLGRTTSNKEVIEWLQRAIDQGSAEALYKLGIVYWFQQSGTSDPAHGLQLIRRAAAQGYVDAAVWLARAYHQGGEMPVNLVAAYALHFLATQEPSDNLQQLASYQPPFDDAMSAEEVARAKQLALDMAKPGNFLVALDSAVAGEKR